MEGRVPTSSSSRRSRRNASDRSSDPSESRESLRESSSRRSERLEEWNLASAVQEQDDSSAQGVRFKLSWGAKHVPKKIKVRKHIDVWLLRFKVGFDYDVSTDVLSPVGGCKEKLTGGSLRLDAGSKKLEYCRRFDLGSAAGVSIRASCNYTALAGEGLQPRLFFMMESSRQGMWARTNREGFDIRTKVPLLPAIAAEICGNVKIPLPAAEYSQEAEHRRLVIGSGDLHIHVAELNAYLYF